MSDAQAFLLAVVAGFGTLLVALGPQAVPGFGLLLGGRKKPRATRKVVRSSLFALATGLLASGIFGVGPVALLAAALGASGAFAAAKRVAEQQKRLLREMWPQLLDTVRVDLTLTQVPLATALFVAAGRLPPPLAGRFVRAERIWANSVDFDRALAVLAHDCDDAFTDVVCESLRTIAKVPSRQIGRRLHAVASDLRTTVRYAKDAEATLAGARFARRFVVIVPVVMALVGVWVAEGRAAYQTAVGQLVGAVALVVMLGCWWWAGRLLQMPEPPRVFAVETTP